MQVRDVYQAKARFGEFFRLDLHGFDFNPVRLDEVAVEETDYADYRKQMNKNSRCAPEYIRGLFSTELIDSKNNNEKYFQCVDYGYAGKENDDNYFFGDFHILLLGFYYHPVSRVFSNSLP